MDNNMGIPDVPELVRDVRRYNNNVKLKDAGAVMELTMEQLAEMERIMEDPIYFIERYCYIVSVDHGYVPLKLYPYQREMVKLVDDNRYSIAKLPRQAGKCVSYGSLVNIRRKKDGAVYQVQIGQLMEWAKVCKELSRQAGKQKN